jgi:hypothetical protein
VNGFVELFGQGGQQWPRLRPHVRLLDDGEADLQQGRSWPVGPGLRVPLDEAVVHEHGQQPVSGGMSDTEIAAGIGQPQSVPFVEQPQQPQGIVDRADRISRLRAAPRTKMCLHNRITFGLVDFCPASLSE